MPSRQSSRSSSAARCMTQSSAAWATIISPTYLRRATNFRPPACCGVPACMSENNGGAYAVSRQWSAMEVDSRMMFGIAKAVMLNPQTLPGAGGH